VDIWTGITDNEAAKVVDGLNLQVSEKAAAIEQIKNLYKLFSEKDCTLLEVGIVLGVYCILMTLLGDLSISFHCLQINPLAETSDGKLVAADAKLNFDDNSAFRQQDVFALRDTSQEDPREVIFVEISIKASTLEYSLNHA
jgi:succinyl-CoA synthetase beta subunit